MEFLIFIEGHQEKGFIDMLLIRNATQDRLGFEKLYLHMQSM